MQVGLLMVFQNFQDGTSDRAAWERDIHLAGLAEPLGFDTLSAVEHHFYNYAMSPDNTQFLGHMAAKTQRIKLLTGAVILPWNDPLRVVERMIVLDHLSKGRALFGIGRGLARREYDVFGVDMNEARDRFDEAAELIIRGLETGIVEGNGRLLQTGSHRSATAAVRELQRSFLRGRPHIYWRHMSKMMEKSRVATVATLVGALASIFLGGAMAAPLLVGSMAAGKAPCSSTAGTLKLRLTQRGSSGCSKPAIILGI